jgi:hypothetical protein
VIGLVEGGGASDDTSLGIQTGGYGAVDALRIDPGYNRISLFVPVFIPYGYADGLRCVHRGFLL